MEAEEGDECTAYNLSVADSRELRDIVQQVVDSAGAHAVDLFPRFSAVVSYLLVFLLSPRLPSVCTCLLFKS